MSLIFIFGIHGGEHDVLIYLQKLKHYGFDETATELIRNYFNDISQHVIVNDTYLQMIQL